MAGELETRIVAQVGIIVDDIEAKAKAWADLFGLPVPEVQVTNTYEITHAQYRGHPTMARAKLAFFKFANIDIELIEPMGEPSTWNDQLEQHGASLHHLAFRVHDREEMVEMLPALQAKGLTLVQRGDWQPDGRYAYLDGTEKIGCVLELLPGRTD